MIIILLYFFLSTITGIINLGVRFLWVDLYKIRKAATPPQGLLFINLLLMLSLTALNYSLTMVVTPQYGQFGYQKYVSKKSRDGILCFNR